VTDFERVAEHVSGDLACPLELEHWQAKVGESEDVTTFVLRVTTALRREQDSWKIIHRHADPITTFDPSGPMRGSPG
jgi:ketosteroid isomerase-like protein